MCGCDIANIGARSTTSDVVSHKQNNNDDKIVILTNKRAPLPCVLCILSKYYCCCCCCCAAKTKCMQAETKFTVRTIGCDIYSFPSIILITESLKIIKIINTFYLETVVFFFSELISQLTQKMERTQCHIHFGMRLCCPTNGFWSFAKYWFDNRTMNAAAQSHTQQQQQK